ncbi:hypothetical protein PPYR_00145 [Photinus pyralis]|uniref:Protein krueppel n=1 Tax=Photinus pyralis TaxID=7054 RepID=A0A1Y1MG00_PHOPY|nr:gastrula zinc finger protein XlCGF57.1-like [Photinus pyralis]KAB0803175.1 hypothetical protein PPYR_00145 [Photinus pyralis]
MFEMIEENEKLVVNNEKEIVIHENSPVKVETKDCMALDVDKTCRVCLEVQEEENLYSLYGINEYFSSTSIFKVIDDCFGVMLQQDDTLPSAICSQCALSTLQACNFKHTMLNSEYILSKTETEVTTVNSKDDISSSLSLTDDSFSSVSFDHNYSVKTEKKENLQNEIDGDQSAETTCIDKVEVEYLSTQDQNLQLYDTSEKWWLTDLGSPYDCRICNRIFENYVEFYSHVRSHFIRQSICIHCGEKVGGKLKFHVCTHSEESNICVYCLIVFKTSEDLEKHLKTHVPEVLHMYLCDICGEGFQENTALETHSLSHSGGTPQYICEYCGQSFVLLQTYRKHEQRFHSNTVKDGQIHKCNNCLKVFSNPKSLVQHFKIHTAQEQLKCDICGLTFRLPFSYNVHMFLHKVRMSTFNSMSLNCAFCFDMFTNKDDLEEHLLDHIEKPYQCHECHKFFPTKAKVKQHLIHHSGERPYTCEYCSKTFKNPTTLYQHKKIHIGKRPYVCKICLRSFIQQQQLTSHMFTHTGEKKYVCQYCGKAFALNGNLTVHVRRHTGDTPFHCTTCGKGFYDSSTLKKHIVWKHTD